MKRRGYISRALLMMEYQEVTIDGEIVYIRKPIEIICRQADAFNEAFGVSEKQEEPLFT